MHPPIRRAAAFDVSYRPLAEADLPFIAALYASTRAEEVAATGWPEEMQRASWTQQIQAQHNHYQGHYPTAEWLIVEAAGSRSAGSISTTATATPPDRHLALPERRGGGIGTAIMADLLDWAARPRQDDDALRRAAQSGAPALRAVRLQRGRGAEAGGPPPRHLTKHASVEGAPQVRISPK